MFSRVSKLIVHASNLKRANKNNMNMRGNADKARMYVFLLLISRFYVLGFHPTVGPILTKSEFAHN